MTVSSKPSLRYELILDGAVRLYPDKREICCDTPKGKIEYRRRTELMRLRQHGICCLCPKLMSVEQATFEHSAGRGFNSSHRDDRIVDEEGNEMNGAAHWDCNGKKGSRRS